jgi:hypothetical protein
MIPLHSQHLLNDREREIRRRAEDERRVRQERARDDPFGMDAEIRVLVERGLSETICRECEDELTEAAG